nr:MAG TPA: Protein of unknown function (DUF4236) [Bacteriophage sp.]
MGLRFRKSVKIGGIRLNFSNSGVGWSWGWPGFRVTHTARGTVRKTYSIPGTGISWVEEHTEHPKTRSAPKPPKPTPEQQAAIDACYKRFETDRAIAARLKKERFSIKSGSERSTDERTETE